MNVREFFDQQCRKKGRRVQVSQKRPDAESARIERHNRKCWDNRNQFEQPFEYATSFMERKGKCPKDSDQ